MPPTDRPSIEVVPTADPEAPPPLTRCCYRGRLRLSGPASDGEATFDDLVMPSELNDAMSSADIVSILDPMSFPWNSIDLDVNAVVIIDASMCSDDDLDALLPVLGSLTAADTVIDPTDSPSRSLSRALGTRTHQPSVDEWPAVQQEKHLLRADRRITDRIAREIGDHAIVQRVEIDELVASGIRIDTYLSEAAAALDSTAVGLWGVRTEPGAPLHHGWAIFEPTGHTNQCIQY